MKFLIMAYYVILSQIVLPANDRRDEVIIKSVSSFKISTSWKTLTDNATIEIPRNTKEFNDGELNELIQRGDAIEIHAGYDQLTKEFEGFVTSVNTDIPIKIKCEDYMWKLKQVPVSISKQNVKLQSLLEEVVKGVVVVDALDLDFKSFKMTGNTVAGLLLELKDKYGIYSYMKNGVLVSGKIYTDDLSSDAVKFEIGRNTPIDGNQLEYRDPNLLSLKVRVESLQRDGSKLYGQAGDPEGEEILDSIPYLSEAEANEFAERRYQIAQRGGFTGSFKAFAIPRVYHGEIVDLFNPVTQLGGNYFVDSVDLELKSTPELSQTITLGIAAS